MTAWAEIHASVRLARQSGASELAEHVAEPVSVIFTSRDPQPLPDVTGALKLAHVARGAGWSVRVGYAMAVHPDRYHANGNLAKRAHVLASVCVYFRRASSGERGWALWSSIDGAGWRFDGAYCNGERFGWSVGEKIKTRSILERVTDGRSDDQ